MADLSIGNAFVEECVLPLGLTDDCQDFFDVTENQIDIKLIMSSDLQGRIVDGEINKKGFYFNVYNDGTIEKLYLLSH